jgi:hypothetical protein
MTDEQSEERREHRNKESFFDRLSWEDYVWICFTFIATIIFIINFFSYTQVPSPVYGGDYYRDRGFVNNIVAGNPIWSDGFYLNEIQYYPYLVFVVEAGIVKITGMSVDHVFLFFPIIIFIISAWIWYRLGHRLFKSKKYGLLTSIAFSSIVHWVYPKSAGAAVFLLVPAFFYFWICYEQEGHLKQAILTGVMLGLVSLVWGGIFLAAVAMFAGTVIVFFVLELIHKKTGQGFFGLLLTYIKKYYLITIITIIIAMLFFGPLLIKYRMHEYNHVTQWGDTKLELLGPSWLFATLKQIFLNTTSIPFFIVSLISLGGLILLILTKKTKEHLFILMIFLVNVITIQHQLITKPLFGFSFLPEKLVYVMYLAPLFFVFGVKALVHHVNKNDIKKYVFFAAIVLLALLFIVRYNEFRNWQWEKYGRSDNTYTQSLLQFGDWVHTNVPADKTILSNDESGFMVAVMSGRRVVLTRRTHANYYVDIDERIAEASVAMYGNDTAKTKEILKKYDVGYFFADQQLLQNEMRVRTDLKPLLQKYNVSFVQQLDRYDVALPLAGANTMELLIIPPQTLNPEFLKLWDPLYPIMVQGQTVGVLYKLKNG